MKGAYIVAEGQDGNGKATFIDGIISSCYKRVLDLRKCWQIENLNDADLNPLVRMYGKGIIKEMEEHGKKIFFADKIPEYKDLKKHFNSFEAIAVCEPTWANVGLAIRKHYTHELKGRNYNGCKTATFYAADREELLTKLIIPARAAGVDIFSERDRTSSYVYQMLQDSSVSGIEQLRILHGNEIADANYPDLIVILELSAEIAMKRLKERARLEGKDDESKFENIAFQQRVREKYISPETKKLLEGIGSKVTYVCTEYTTKEENKKNAALIFSDFKNGKLKERYLYK